MRREIQSFEIVVIVLNFRSGRDIEAEFVEYIKGAIHGTGHRVQAASLLSPARQGDIHPLAQ